MKNLLIALTLAIVIQVALSAPRQAVEGENGQTKRFKLMEFAYDNLRETVWPVEVYPQMTEYMNKVKEWSDNDETLKKSPIYDDLQEEIDNCLDLLKELTADSDNCDKQLALRESHDKIRTLFDGEENEKLKHDWAKKYMNFSLQMRVVMRNSYENFYTLLKAEVDSYLKDLDGMEATALVEWDKKFNQENDFMKKQFLVMEFMRLFPEERPLLETKCKVQFSNGL